MKAMLTFTRLLNDSPWKGRWSDERKSDVAVVRFGLQGSWLDFTERVQAYEKESRNYLSIKKSTGLYSQGHM